MKPYDIKAAIERAGTSQTAIAEFLKVSPSCVHRVVQGKARSKRVEAELAKIVGKPVFAATAKQGAKKTVWTGKVAA